MANANQALGQNVERNPIILEGDESMVRDRHAMGIARQIMQNMFRTAEGWFGVDNPVLSEKLSEKSAKTVWLGETPE